MAGSAEIGAAWRKTKQGSDETYVRGMAELFAAQLDPSRHIYVEYSNEMWNCQFTSYNALFIDAAVALGLDPSTTDCNTLS